MTKPRKKCFPVFSRQGLRAFSRRLPDVVIRVPATRISTVLACPLQGCALFPPSARDRGVLFPAPRHAQSACPFGPAHFFRYPAPDRPPIRPTRPLLAPGQSVESRSWPVPGPLAPATTWDNACAARSMASCRQPWHPRLGHLAEYPVTYHVVIPGAPTPTLDSREGGRCPDAG